MLTADALPEDEGVLAADGHDEGQAGAEAQRAGAYKCSQIHILQRTAGLMITPAKYS